MPEFVGRIRSSVVCAGWDGCLDFAGNSAGSEPAEVLKSVQNTADGKQPYQDKVHPWYFWYFKVNENDVLRCRPWQPIRSFSVLWGGVYAWKP